MLTKLPRDLLCNIITFLKYHEYRTSCNSTIIYNNKPFDYNDIICIHCDISAIKYIALICPDTRSLVYYLSIINCQTLFGVKQIPFVRSSYYDNYLHKLFDYIDSNDQLMIAGGFPMQILLNPHITPNITSDIDIYVFHLSHGNSRRKVITDLMLYLSQNFTIDNILTRHSVNSCVVNNIWNIFIKEIPYVLQIILTRCNNPLSIVKGYDYSHSKVFIYKGRMYATVDALHAHKTKITYNYKTRWIICRIQKAIKNGFKIDGLDEDRTKELMKISCCTRNIYKERWALLDVIKEIENRVFHTISNDYSYCNTRLHTHIIRNESDINIKYSYDIIYYNMTISYYTKSKIVPANTTFRIRYFDPDYNSLDAVSSKDTDHMKSFQFGTKDNVDILVDMCNRFASISYEAYKKAPYTLKVDNMYKCNYHRIYFVSSIIYIECMACAHNVMFSFISKKNNTHILRCHRSSVVLDHGKNYYVTFKLDAIGTYFEVSYDGLILPEN